MPYADSAPTPGGLVSHAGLLRAYEVTSRKLSNLVTHAPCISAQGRDLVVCMHP